MALLLHQRETKDFIEKLFAQAIDSLVALSSCVVYKTQTSSKFTGLNCVVHCRIDNYLQILSVCQEFTFEQCNCNFLLTAMIYEITIYKQE